MIVYSSSLFKKEPGILFFPDIFNDVVDGGAVGGILLHVLLHLLDGVIDGGVIPAAELLADGRLGHLCDLPDHIDGDLAGVGDLS